MTIVPKHLRKFISPLNSAAIAALSIAALTPGLAHAQVQVQARDHVLTPTPQPILTRNTLLGAAVPDECFSGIGIDYPPLNPDGTCPSGSKLKTNDSYIWGLTEESNVLYFGTLANGACLNDGHGPASLGESNLLVCEFAQSEVAREHASLPASLGDWRPPKIYSYDLGTSTLVNRTPPDPLIYKTVGFRGAGSIGGIAFLGGQALAANAANVFAFKADTGQYLGSCSLAGYTYIRQWSVVDGVLYVGAGTPNHGSVLRWNGGINSFRGNFCDDFAEVGVLTADVANIAQYTGADGQDRLAVTTVAIRAGSNGNGAGVGTWISPPIPAGGLTPDQANGWKRVWSPQQYEPDPIVAQFGYGGGAIQQFDGWLYWGTINIQQSAAYRVEQTCQQSFCFGPILTPEDAAALQAGVYRSTSLWRGRSLEDPRTRQIQLVYGETQLPVCCSAPKTFSPQPTGWTPLYGPSGFGNPSNEYTWTMAVFDGHLFIGTYDASAFQNNKPEFGADLWRIDSSDTPAVNENFSGLGNKLNYGVRAMMPLDDGSGMVAGMADPFNLAPDGWELRLLQEADVAHVRRSP